MTNQKRINVNTWLDDSKLNAFSIGIIIICFAILIIDGYDMFVYGATVPLLLKAFHMGPAQAGLIGSCSLIGAAIGALCLGSLADIIGRKYTIVCCVTVFCIAMGLTGFTNSPALFGLFRVICGIGIGGTLPNVVALTSEYTPLRNRAWGIAAVSSGMPLGAIVAPAISLWLLPLYGWRAVYFVGAIPILIVPVALKWMPESPVHLIKRSNISKLKALVLKARPHESLPADAAFEVNKASGKAPVIDLFRERRALSTILFCLTYFVSYFQIYGLGVWLPKLMMNRGFSLGKGLWFALALAVGAFVATHIGGLVADRLGLRGTIIVCFLISFCAVALLGSSNGLVMLTILAALSGAGNSTAMNLAHTFVSTYYPQSMRSTAMGFAFGIGRFGGILGPVMAGVLLSFHAQLSVIFIILGSTGVICSILISLVQKKHSFSYLSRQAPAQAELRHS